MHNIDINAPVGEDYQDPFGLSECEEFEEIEEVSNTTESNKTKTARGARQGVNSVRLSLNDADILEFMKDKGSFSKYVKKLIRAEIERTHKTEDLTDIKILNDKVDQVLSILQSRQILDTNFTENNPSKNEVIGEVYGNPYAHKFDPIAAAGVRGILGKQLQGK